MLNSPNGMFSAWITVDGVETPEYHVETSTDNKVVACWIASETGKKFSIHWKNFAYAADAKGDIEIDGTSLSGRFLYGKKLPACATKDGVREGEMVRPFVFSSLATTDDDDYLHHSSSEKLGTIELSIYPIEVLPSTGNVKRKRAQALDNITVHERSKKAASVTQQIALVSKIQIDPETR
ncbi:hypothetical protein FB45DRAFT_1019058 [Roridomyces roridus]|uniref:DUF7918 domain-containing protein n=1 Tax=Roridomyces roridus TaxID=1738132 RepID=A0AAD7CEA6_9AGAR|nr:hypothetical protein FB45DRAFT_1019058 [Roridomyces roridus]